MTFQRKSLATMIVILAVVSGSYATVVARAADGAPVGDVAYRGHLFVAFVALVIAAAVAHAVGAAASIGETRDMDPPDPHVKLRSQQVARTVLATGALAGLGLAVANASAFWIVHALAGLVLAEIAAGATSLFGSRHRRRRAVSPATK